MFAGHRRRSSNVRTMQLFYELKQRYPTASDAKLNTCIASYVESNSGQGEEIDPGRLLDNPLGENQKENDAGQMGRPSTPREEALPPRSHPLERPPHEMHRPTDDAMATKVETLRPPAAKRPSHLDIKCDVDRAYGATSRDDKRKFNIQLSEKCRNVPKLLNSEVSEKPPLSPSGGKRAAAVKVAAPETQRQEDRSSTEVQKRLTQDPPTAKKETCSTPTQTTDTLLGSPNNLKLSLNVNCSLDLLHSPLPSTPRRTSVAQLVPAQPWLPTPTTTSSPRSFTSVNLTLRPPASSPQDPIDITSKNSSLTYSTSSFDSAKGLQSRLQITVGPAGGSVSSVRVRPKSYHAQEGRVDEEAAPARAGSLDDLAVSLEPPVLLKQQARIERLRIEMKTRRAKLQTVRREIEELEKNRLIMSQRDSENRLLMDIKHLTWQCKDLESDGDAFYSNIYTGPHGPLTPDRGALSPSRRPQQNRRRPPYPRRRDAYPPTTDAEGPKWNCVLCTFLNHPVLDKCEQCEMPRIVHGTNADAVNRNVTVDALRLLDGNGVRAASRSLSLSNAVFYGGERAVARGIDSSRSTPNMLGLVQRKN